ncbi:MAG: cysteine--tRNA ligase [Candidatus Taylorbacteria bacterium]|nr:cysteine--tRNA ligase [Candidatus Taylorbacteria bacterium]
MAIALYNTLSGKKEEFISITKGKVGIYNCGPTVYDYAHIGNFRTGVLYDIIRRVFEFDNYEVTQVMNITDVDDKTIRRSRAEKITLETLTNKYENIYFEEIKLLNILTPHKILSARGYIKEIIAMIETLIKNGSAYTAKDGVYFKIKDSKNYGALTGVKLENLTQERIENDEYDKENPRDFALWKFYKDEDGDVVWAAPFGRGRPGWHIECSAMATSALGDTIDIHAGGTDLIFPHHTNEIAQSEAATGKSFVHYWLHGAMINVTSDKMSKSKGNFFKLADLTEHSISPVAYRYWLLTAHYRTQVNFTWEAVAASQTALIKLYTHFTEFGIKASGENEVDAIYHDKFLSFINDDLDMPKALALTWELVKDKKISDSAKHATLIEFDRVFGLGLATFKPDIPSDTIPPEIKALADAREEARKEKDFTKADALRIEIESRGYEIKDTEKGVKIIKH